MSSILLGAAALGLIWSITTLGVFMTYRVLDIADLTVEGSIVFGAVTAAVAIQAGIHPVWATLLAFLAGMIAGLGTAFLHIAMKIPSLLAGILSMIALYSINIRVMGGSSNVSLLRLSTVFSGLTEKMPKNTAVILVGGLVVILVVGLLYWFLGTEIGSALRATGFNAQMARAQGINTRLMTLMGYVLANGLVGLSGGLLSQYMGFADVQMGTGSIVIALASLIVGEVIFARKGGLLLSLFSMVLGSVVYRFIIAMVFEAGMPASDLKLFTAITVALALWLPHVKTKWSGRRKNNATTEGRCESVE